MSKEVRLEIEVPGTPEEVWEAIATGPGVTSWFVPSEIDGREGGDYTTTHADGENMSATERIAAFEPPHRIVTEWEQDGDTLATEWFVEARSGGTCIVRLVSSPVAETDKWDDHIDSLDHGWRGYLENLRLYLTHFAAQPCSTVLVMGGSPAGNALVAWEELRAAIGFGDATPGARVAGTDGATAVAGLVERNDRGYVLMLLDEPAPGLALIGAYGSGETTMIVVHLYLFGERGAAVAADAQTAWRAWMDDKFPAKVTF